MKEALGHERTLEEEDQGEYEQKGGVEVEEGGMEEKDEEEEFTGHLTTDIRLHWLASPQHRCVYTGSD